MKLAWLLIPSLAAADVRVEAHVAAGMEGSVISGEARPDGVSEYGVGAAWMGGRLGVGFVVERVARLSSALPTQSETKVDALVMLRGRHRFLAGFGAGLRQIVVAGAPDRRGSTLWGVDLLRMQGSVRITRVGPVNLDFYFAWTFGVYKGEVYGMRHGDMPYPVRDFMTAASSYVVGFGTSFDTQP